MRDEHKYIIRGRAPIVFGGFGKKLAGRSAKIEIPNAVLLRDVRHGVVFLVIAEGEKRASRGRNPARSRVRLSDFWVFINLLE